MIYTERKLKEEEKKRETKIEKTYLYISVPL